MYTALVWGRAFLSVYMSVCKGGAMWRWPTSASNLFALAPVLEVRVPCFSLRVTGAESFLEIGFGLRRKCESARVRGC